MKPKDAYLNSHEQMKRLLNYFEESHKSFLNNYE